jgi:NADPH-dependent glutamate synthase beta subunit-like oxidoreductase
VARRLGAAEVRCVYRRSEAEAPARVEELRHAREEGVQFSFLHAPVEVLLDEQTATCAACVRRRWCWANPTPAAGARRCRWTSLSNGPATA